ncbi:hypothetical protein FHL15_007798 [Xylaria flabelliformis]|uniref:Apple domain-containing protein n=1 Tax=Xylaria flabelliformis TaxID=2512241 RepID=A0A553HTV8_9PEZI|nr:hypothetical protein FHL15_007798 [Xylaria flabelliformis]
MGSNSTTTWTSNPPCPHSNGLGAPVCWDCAEGGHVRPSTVEEDEGASPSWQRLKKFRRSLSFRTSSYSRSNVSLAGTQISTLEVRSPEEGLEVGTPHSRRSQPGLILVEGPRVVSPEDKFLKPELKTWDSQSTQKGDETSVLNIAAVEPTEEKKRIWGIQRRTFQILIVVVVLTFAGVIIGIAVAVMKQNRVHSTSSPTSSGGQVSSTSSPMPLITATKTISYYVAGDSSTFVTLSETDTHSSSRRVGSVMASTGTTTTATGKGGGTEPTTIVADTATVFVAVQQPSHANTIPSQPTTVVVSSSPPAQTSQVSSPSTPSNSSRICLGDDGSTYTDPGTGDKFRIECAVAHQGKDIENLEAETMQDCISLCAKNKFCKGAIWFNVGPQGTDLNYCWLKSAMNGEVQENTDAQSVVLL